MGMGKKGNPSTMVPDLQKTRTLWLLPESNGEF
jgi:hypothetical protein